MMIFYSIFNTVFSLQLVIDLLESGNMINFATIYSFIFQRLNIYKQCKTHACLYINNIKATAFVFSPRGYGFSLTTLELWLFLLTNTLYIIFLVILQIKQSILFISYRFTMLQYGTLHYIINIAFFNAIFTLSCGVPFIQGSNLTVDMCCRFRVTASSIITHVVGHAPPYT